MAKRGKHKGLVIKGSAHMKKHSGGKRGRKGGGKKRSKKR